MSDALTDWNCDDFEGSGWTKIAYQIQIRQLVSEYIILIHTGTDQTRHWNVNI